MASFTPPTTDLGRLPAGPTRRDDGLWRRLESLTRGQNVWKDSGGVWHTGVGTMDDAADAEYFFLGGRTHTVSAAVASELTGAGYTVT